jgi:hypothetical protein
MPFDDLTFGCGLDLYVLDLIVLPYLLNVFHAMISLLSMRVSLSKSMSFFELKVGCAHALTLCRNGNLCASSHLCSTSLLYITVQHHLHTRMRTYAQVH